MKKFTLFTIVAILAFALVAPQVMAASEVNFYGSVRFHTGILDRDSENFNLPAGSTALLGNLDGFAALPNNFQDDSDQYWGMENTLSRFGAMFKAGDLGGHIEIRPWSASYYRHWYATYNFGAGTLLIGHTWDPLFLSSTPGAGLNFGGLGLSGSVPNGLRQEQLKLTFPTEIGTLFLAALDNGGSTTLLDANGAVTVISNDVDTSLPTLEAGFNFKPFGPLALNVFWGYNKVELSNNTALAETTYDLTGWTVGLGGRVTFGPVWVHASYATAENPNQLWNSPHYWEAQARWNGTSIVDCEADFYRISAGAKINDMISIQIDYGMQDIDIPNIAGAINGWESTQSMWVIAVPITICKGFTIQPEYVSNDWGERNFNDPNTPNLKFGKTDSYGINWQIDF